jgi:hypothetical protein
MTQAEIADLLRRNRLLEANELLCLRAMTLLDLSYSMELVDSELDELEEIQLRFLMNRIELNRLN